MLVNELQIIHYPKRGPCRSKISQKPTWPQIEAAIQQLDRHKYPFLKVFLPLAVAETNLRSMNIIGGCGEYGILTFDSNERQLQWFCDYTRSNGPESINIWTSDQGASFKKRYLSDRLDVVLRITELFAMTGQLDLTVTWEAWPP